MRTSLGLMLCCAHALTALANNAAPTPLEARLARAVEQMNAGGIVLMETDTTGTRTFIAGQPSPRAGLPPERIIFEIGSITKVFTSVLLAQTVLEGRATLSDPISRHLPSGLPVDPRVAAITLAQLATHTSGLPRLPHNLEPTRPGDPYAGYDEARLLNFLREFHPDAAPPQPASYSNLGAGLLGHLLERIHGMSYADLLATKITRPLGLLDTAITLDADQTARFAPPHSGSERVPPWTFDALAGAGAIRSTAADLVAFGTALLQGTGPLEGVIALVGEPHSDFAGPRIQIGLSLLINTHSGERVLMHSGGTGGFRSHLELRPASGGVRVILLNNDAPEPAQFAGRWGDQTVATSEPTVAIDPAQLAAYVGVYRIDAQRAFTALLTDDGRLVMRLTGQPFLTLLSQGGDRFAVRDVQAEFQFTRDGTGDAVRVTLHQRGHETSADRTTEKTPTVRFLPPNELAAYEGTYRLGPGAVFDVTTRANHLFVKLTGQQALPVFSDRPDHFVYDVVTASLTFERDTTGAIVAVVLHQNGRNQRAPRETPATAQP